MATDVQIGGTGEVGKVRNPLAPIGLSIITLGIYGLVWYYKINKELAAVGKSRNSEECGDNPTTSILAVTIGAIVIIPALVSFFNTWKRVDAAAKLVGTEPSIPPIGGFIVTIIFSPVGYFLLQSSMNKVLEAQGGAAAAPVAAAA